MIRKPNSIIVLLFIQNNSQFKNIAKTSLLASMLSLSLIVCVQVCPAPQIFSKQQMSSSELSSCCFCYVFSHYFAQFQLQMSEVSAILVFTTKTTQSGPQVFSVTGALTCRKLQFDVISSSNTKFLQIWSSVNVMRQWKSTLRVIQQRFKPGITWPGTVTGIFYYDL